MKSNNFLIMCLISIGLYGSSVEAYNPAYKTTVNAKNGLGSTYRPVAPRKTVKVSTTEISGAPWTPWAKSTGLYDANKKTAILKSGKSVHRFYDVKSVPRASMVMYGSPYVKFAQDRDHVLYGRPGISGVA